MISLEHCLLAPCVVYVSHPVLDSAYRVFGGAELYRGHRHSYWPLYSQSHCTFQFTRSILAPGCVELEKAQENLGPRIELRLVEAFTNASKMARIFIDDWFIKLPGSQYKPHVEEVNALEDFLSGFISPQEAAKKFTTVTSSTTDNVEKGLYRLWPILIALGKKFPDTQDELVELLRGIKSLPDLKVGGEIVTVGELKVWRDLPLFRSEIRSCWISKLSSLVQVSALRREPDLFVLTVAVHSVS